MEKHIENLNWRYATKKFDTSKKLSEDTVEKLLKSLQLSASSYGLQPYEIFVVSDEKTKEQLKLAGWNQAQFTDASHIFIFAGLKHLDEAYIDSYVKNISDIRDIQVRDLGALKEKLMKNIVEEPRDQQKAWAQKQAYLALGNFLSAAADLKIDTCPMEGYDTEKVDEVLGINNTNLSTAVVASAGYRSKDDALQHAKKVRKQKEELFHLI